MLLSEVLPEYHYRERHSREVDAAPERVLAAIREVTLAEIPVALVLAQVRGIRARTTRPLVGEMTDSGFALLAEAPGRELVYGAIGRPWKLRGGGRPHYDDFASFSEPGYAKMAMNFRFDGRSLSTETRVLLTDERSRRVFRRYWLVIRPFSGLIRRVWLRAVDRRARRWPT